MALGDVGDEMTNSREAGAAHEILVDSTTYDVFRRDFSVIFERIRRAVST